jgi:hypothetical protein
MYCPENDERWCYLIRLNVTAIEPENIGSAQAGTYYIRTA